MLPFLTPLKITKIIQKLTRNMTWPAMFGLIIMQAAITYVLFVLANERALIEHPLQFFYYNMVVVSTVGFGDFSPQTSFGRLIVAFWQIPSGLIVFASFIGKTTQLFIDIARKNMNGSNDFSHLTGHILLFCWDKHSTKQVIQLILGDKKRHNRQILLCVTEDMENPFPEIDEVSFAKLDSFSDTQELDRVGLKTAQRIIIDGSTDDETLSIALSIATFTDKNANITAHFFDESKAKLLKIHCPYIECSIDNSAQIMVRSMQDPGSSQVTERLLSTLNGATLYSILIPDLITDTSFGELFKTFKQRYDMILIGFSKDKSGNDMSLNPTNDAIVSAGYHLYYIANERLYVEDIDWQDIN
ncbi:potassium channel family protein [Psychromonas sp. SR45-3]|uniref:potassium channel family protein n=1 Tax=Psychromonas sp. SR45-3 TaxID=2760930 RepID=UPI0015FA2A32|nr:potassium channel family protein [Psychromonas sp. SR45-3]MBB1273689.1 two pore domain potassium channel family protein [Psychromonas sp. SR45-3]